MTPLSNQFNEDGYFVIRNLLDKDEIDSYRNKLIELAGDQAQFDPAKAAYERWAIGDGVSAHREFWPIIFNERLLTSVREAFSDDGALCFTQHSDLHVNNGVIGWHRDSANRRFGTGPDWDESRAKYRIVRVAIYLQSFEESGFRLGLMPGSHRLPYQLFEFQCRAFAFIRRQVTAKRNILPPIVLGRKPVWIETNPGDCVVFDPRLLHSGSPVHGPKYAIYLSYGVNNEHSRRHRNYYLKERPDIGYRQIPSELAARLQAEGLLLE